MSPWTAYAIMWVSVCCTIIYGMEMTGKWGLLWFLLVPACVGIHTEKGSGDESDKKDGEGGK